VNPSRVCNTKYRYLDSRIVDVYGHQGSALTEWRHFFSRKSNFLNSAAFSNSFWPVAVLAVAGVIGTAGYAEASTSSFWPDSDPGVSRPAPAGPPPQRHHKTVRRHPGPKDEVVAKESAKPHGPLVIAISIDKQTLKIYDDNGFFAETPISTGMRGHPTPMGVFSVIQKDKFHRSNIYSGAPMPYMQRITWSGVAIHAGVLPGYPASHGCIRMPMNFAVKMWGWTKMGARVVVAPGELSPTSFSHPLLSALNAAPPPVASVAPSETKSDKMPIAIMAPMSNQAQPALPREQAQTADASGAMPPSGKPATMSDATTSAGGRITTSDQMSTDKAIDAASAETKPEATAGAEKTAELPSEAKPVETKSTETAADTEPVISDKPEIRTTLSDPSTSAPDKGAAKPATPPETVKAEAAAHEPAKSAETAAARTETSAGADKPEVKSATTGEAGATVTDVKKDQARPSEKAAVAKPEPVAAPKRAGQIAVFISRKDNKLYVRQNFAPLFQTPVTIAPGDRPLGTHVFTAEADKSDAKTFHWSVVSLPMGRYAERRDDDERASRRRKTVGVVETKPVPTPDTPAEALDRITIPADAAARIADALSTGGSLVVSDQGIAAGETGEGTDFIVSLR
jgi:lipoprotein-anchoring transpeptidase ErfK/SrfK